MGAAQPQNEHDAAEDRRDCPEQREPRDRRLPRLLRESARLTVAVVIDRLGRSAAAGLRT